MLRKGNFMKQLSQFLLVGVLSSLTQVALASHDKVYCNVIANFKLGDLGTSSIGFAGEYRPGSNAIIRDKLFNLNGVFGSLSVFGDLNFDSSDRYFQTVLELPSGTSSSTTDPEFLIGDSKNILTISGNQIDPRVRNLIVSCFIYE